MGNDLFVEIMGDLTNIHAKVLTDSEKIARVRALMAFWSDVQKKREQKLRVLDLILSQLAAALGDASV